MNRPILDPRTKEELMDLIQRRAGEYVPEWRYEQGDETDPGAAIATLFGELFYQTIDRFNLLPQKHYTEFLNLLGVPGPGVTPACGLVQFTAGGAGGPVPVPAGTEIFAASPEGDGTDIVFATSHRIEATTASLQDVYYVDPTEGRIERLDLTKEQPFFAPTGQKNLQFHRFAFAQNQVLTLEGPCELQISLRQSARFLEAGTAEILADPDNATWRYFDGTDYPAFQNTRAEGGILRLFKEDEKALCPEEDGNVYIYCDVSAKVQGSIQVNGIALRSSIPEALPADGVSNNDIPITLPDGGYCFGRRPAAYELFYIRSDRVFCKRGAHVNVQMDIVPVIYSTVGDEPQYEFNKRIIDKNDAVRVVPDDVFVEQVVWEYYNGSGWAKLAVHGNENPFSCKQEGALLVTFTVPEDMDQVLVNAEQGYYIRARVVNVENFLSTKPRWLLPFVKDVRCNFQYDRLRPAQTVRAWNNASCTEILEADQVTDLAMTLYDPLPVHPRAMYLRFDASPHAMPLSILFQVAGETLLPSKILFESWNGETFAQVRTVDQTGNLRYTGTAFLYLPDPLPEATFFGETGYWLRMSMSSFSRSDRPAPQIMGLDFNIVEAKQQQRGAEQYFSTEAYEVDKTLELLESPVLDTEIWVDEINELSMGQIGTLEAAMPGKVRVEREEGAVTHCWVRWERVNNLLLSGRDDRVYEVDAMAGLVHFGNGRSGKVPPKGLQNIRVSYSYGGGSRGNLAEGQVNALLGSLPRITGVKNIAPMCGGTDQPPMEKIEVLGNKGIRHRGRALGASDFEQMVLFRFQRAAHVKCFPNVDQKGRQAPGHVCLVVMGRDFKDERMRYGLCREIYNYLSTRCDCNLIAGNRLHVVPSTEITIHVRAQVQMWDLDQAAVTQQELAGHITALIEKTWRTREIGAQINLVELYRTIKATANVRSVEQVFCEGSYFEEGRRKLCALDTDDAFPFATVRSGTHSIRVV